jgi:Protein of unknown function (DUF3237)
MNTRLLMTLHVSVAPPLNIAAVPHGIRRTVPVSGGHFEGPRLRGTVVPGASARHSWRNATIGSSRHARRAGSHAAISATISIAATAPPIATGSIRVTPKSIDST